MGVMMPKGGFYACMFSWLVFLLVSTAHGDMASSLDSRPFITRKFVCFVYHRFKCLVNVGARSPHLGISFWVHKSAKRGKAYDRQHWVNGAWSK